MSSEIEIKTRTITLSNRPPVKIKETEWPVIAEAKGDSFHGDVGRYRQALHQGEVDTYSLRVRQHADGRVIVYGVLDAAIEAWRAPAGGKSKRSGLLLDKDGDIAAAIYEVADDLGLVEELAADCIADLPAEEI